MRLVRIALKLLEFDSLRRSTHAQIKQEILRIYIYCEAVTLSYPIEGPGPWYQQTIYSASHSSVSCSLCLQRSMPLHVSYQATVRLLLIPACQYNYIYAAQLAIDLVAKTHRVSAAYRVGRLIKINIELFPLFAKGFHLPLHSADMPRRIRRLD